jgi:hypothetical protein
MPLPENILYGSGVPMNQYEKKEKRDMGFRRIAYLSFGQRPGLQRYRKDEVFIIFTRRGISVNENLK